ncbi:unnamed protein product [Arabis nemorensis]|uniref:Uncharacterized protein n=1 Tax=Arabis nemorensis TaxID=586526 RepID=A0A565CVJ7_9BRAS|nr:unnamed protein product [Arabis nemorensis]
MDPPEINLGRHDKFGPHHPSTMSDDDLRTLRVDFQIPDGIELVRPETNESPESEKPGFCCAYEVYFRECGLHFPLPEALALFTQQLGLAISQLCPNFVRGVMGLQTLVEEFGFPLDLPILSRIFTVKASPSPRGYFYLSIKKSYGLLSGRPPKDEHWKKRYFSFPLMSSLSVL